MNAQQTTVAFQQLARATVGKERADAVLADCTCTVNTMTTVIPLVTGRHRDRLCDTQKDFIAYAKSRLPEGVVTALVGDSYSLRALGPLAAALASASQTPSAPTITTTVPPTAKSVIDAMPNDREPAATSHRAKRGSIATAPAPAEELRGRDLRSSRIS